MILTVRTGQQPPSAHRTSLIRGHSCPDHHKEHSPLSSSSWLVSEMSWWETQTWKHGWKGRRGDHFWLESNLCCTYVLHTFAICSFLLPTPKNVFFGSHLIFTHNTELRNWGWGAKQRLESHSLPSENLPDPAWDRFLHQTVHPLPGTILPSQPVMASPQGWRSSNLSSGVMAFFPPCVNLPSLSRV